MKTLFSNGNPIICFSDIVVNSDHLLCDDAVLPLSVIGEYEVVDGCFIEAQVKKEVPTEVTMRQARLALLDVGLLDNINTLLSQDARAKIVWEYATAVYRDEVLVEQMQVVTGMTDEQIDDLFIAASKL